MAIWKEAGSMELLCRRMVMAPDTPAMFHFHENYEFCQPLNRPCDFLVDGTLYHAEPGDIISVDSRVVHRFLLREPDTAIRILQFPVRILLRSGTLGSALQTHIPKATLEQIPGLYSAVCTLMELMEQEPPISSGGKNELLQSLMTSLYLLLLKHFPAKSNQGLRKDTDLFFQATEYANAHFSDATLTVESMAAALYVSREKLSSVFLQYAGISCKQYINTLRVDEANRIMMEGCDISTTALESGFGSIRTFNSVYKGIIGMSPTEYIKKLRSKLPAALPSRHQKEGETVMKNYKDHIWLLGETPGSHHRAEHYHLPGVNKMTPMEGLEFFGIKNLCRMKMSMDMGLSYLDDPYIVGDAMEKCCLSLLGSGAWRPAGGKRDDMDEILAVAKKDKRIIAAINDDFMAGDRPLIYTPEVLRQQRIELHTALERPLELWSVYYDRDVEVDVYAQSREFDVTTFWTWFSENLKDLEKNLQWARSLTPDGRVILGVYMWDYGNGRPMPDDLMKWQLDFAYEKYLSGQIEGMMLCSNCNADLGLSATQITKDWLDQL